MYLIILAIIIAMVAFQNSKATYVPNDLVTSSYELGNVKFLQIEETG